MKEYKIEFVIIEGDFEHTFGRRYESKKEFEEFNKKVKAEIPKMTELYDMATEQEKLEVKKRNFVLYNEIFNKEFDEEKQPVDPFSKGYAHLMDIDKRDEEKEDEKPKNTNHKFTQEIQIYKTPHILPNTYGNNYRFDVKVVKDFSNYEDQFDYVKAHREIKIEKIEDIKDEPIKNLDEILENKIKEREYMKVNNVIRIFKPFLLASE